MQPLDHISYSHVHLTLCPYASFLRYEAGVRGKSTPYLALGNALHTVLEHAHKESNFDLPTWAKDFKSIYNQIIDEEEIFVGFPQLKKLENEGIGMLEIYHAQIESGEITRNALAVEEDFSIPFAGTKIVGRIDRLDDNPESIVTDYKSGKKKPDAWFLRHDYQLTIYYWAFFEKYGYYPKKLRWHHLRTGEFLDTERTPKDIDEVKRVIENIVTMRELGIRHRVRHIAACGDGSPYGISCDFRGAVCDDEELERRTVEGLNEQKLLL